MNLLTPFQDWLQERFNIQPNLKKFINHLHKPLPPHVNFLFTFGTLVLLLFGLQVITGLLMMIYYKPTVGNAYNSVKFIVDQVPFGWLVRQLHIWGTNLMILLIFLHMLKTYFYGGYKKPREITWMTGVLLFSLILGFSFTGGLLPWNQVAFWTTTVSTEIPASLPIVGSLILKVVRGGTQIGEATLGRFFVAHVVLLPFVFLSLCGFHLFLVRILGTSTLQRTDELELKNKALRHAGGKPFLPNQLLKEGIAAYLLIGILLTLAILTPFHLGEPANPFETPQKIKPEWYFLPLFQLLKYLPKWMAMALPTVIGILVFLLPILDRSPERHPKGRPYAILIGLICLILTLTLGILGKISDTETNIFGNTYRFNVHGLPKP